VLDQHGRVVGMVSMMVGETTGLGLALPVNYVYSGADRLIDGDRIPYNTGVWKRRLDDAARDERDEVASIGNAMTRPALVGAAVLRPGYVRAVVVRLDVSPPVQERFTFEVRRNEQLLCTPHGPLTQWFQVPQVAQSGLDSRFVDWLEEHGLMRQAYAGVVSLRMGDCPPPDEVVGARLVMSEADPRANQARLELMSAAQFAAAMNGLGITGEVLPEDAE
jgi:hypothetical protein